MWDVLAIVVFALFLAFLFDALRAREVASRVVRLACRRHGLQFLDDTVHGARLWLARDPDGVMRVRRTFSFEFSDDGRSRRKGRLVMLGAKAEAVEFEPYRIE